MEVKILAPKDGFIPSQESPKSEDPRNSEVVIAVIGTGIDGAHPDLQGRVIGGVSFTDSPWWVDDHGQGTHLAGIICDGAPPVDDWRVEASRKLTAEGDFHPRVFAELRQQTLDLPRESAAQLQEVMAQDWLLQREEALPLTGRVAGLLNQGVEPSRAYSQALSSTSVDLSVNQDFILVGDFEVEVRE